MKVEIIEPNVFSNVKVETLEKYLTALKWVQEKHISAGLSVWQAKNVKKSRVWVPSDSSFADYEENVQRLVRTVSEVENRSQLEIFEDLDTVGQGDVIRLYTYDELNRESTSLPLNDGLEFFEKARNLTVAAALATEKKQAVFSPYRSVEVLGYLKQVRLGQTEKGSYKVKIISPIIQPNLFPNDRIPFERKVILNMMNSLDALQHVSKQIRKKGRYHFEAYQEIVSEGVSANLCEAISASAHGLHPKPLSINVTWSYVIDPPQIKFPEIAFTSEMLLYIEKAAKEFREKNPIEVTIKGFVEGLKKKHAKKVQPTGRVTIYGLVENKLKNVHVYLDDDDYALAVEAHGAEKGVSIDGILKQQGTHFTLEDPKNLHIL